MRLALLGLVLAGCTSWLRSPEPVRVQVEVALPGAVPDQVEELLVRPLETRLTRVEGVGSMLTLAESGRARLQVRLSGVDDIEAVRRASEAVREAMPELPDGVGVPRVHVAEPQRLWLKAGASRVEAHERIGELAREGVGAAIVVEEVPAEVWEVDVRRLREQVLPPLDLVEAVDDALEQGAWGAGETPVRAGAEGVLRLSDVARPVDRAGVTHALVDGSPAVGLAVTGRSSPGPDWVPFAGNDAAETCVLSREAPRTSAGRWVRHGGAWWGRLSGDLKPMPGWTMWPCAAPVVRLAVVGDADWTRARSALLAWDGSLTVVDVPFRAREPKVEVVVRQDRVQGLGLTPAAVSRALSWSGLVRTGTATPDAREVRVMLRWPEDPDVLGQVPVVAPDGQWVPLMTLADLRMEVPRPPPTRVDGQPARVLDVVLAEGHDLSSFNPPPGITLQAIDGLGPDRVWR